MHNFDRSIDRRGFSKKWDLPRYPAASDKPLLSLIHI